MSMKVEFVTTGQADIIVCMEWTSPPILPDNQRGRCAMCGHVVQFRPDAPKKPMRVCVSCVPGVIRGHA